MMMVRGICGMIAGVSLVLVLGSQRAHADQVTVSIDMDPGTPGIQDTWDPLDHPGESTFTSDIVFDVGADGISAYGVSVQFDTLELDVNSVDELLPPGFDFNFTPGVRDTTEDIGDGLTGQISNFEAAIIFSPEGPSNTSFVAGTIEFQVPSLIAALGNGLDDGVADITPGLFDTGFDGISNNANQPADNVVFNSGFVVPEPTTMGLLLLGGLAALRRRRSR